METSVREEENRFVDQWCNEPFYWTLDCDKRIIIHQGGSGSGKTYSVLQYLIHIADTIPGKIIDIGRRTLKSLRSSAYQDYLIILGQSGIVTEENKTELIYTFRNGSMIQFFGLDDPQKVRSRRRDYLYLNEINEISLEMWRQLTMRTREKIIGDFNPSDPIHWVYDHVMPRKDCETFISTFLHNEFLSEGEKEEILSYKDRDEDYWNVFGLGQRGVFLKGQIFKGWKKISTLPEDYDDEVIGLDFGYSNDPNAVVKIRKKGDALYLRQILYQNKLTNPQIAEEIREEVGDTEVFCDNSEPKSIKELREHGINAKPCIKSGINEGIKHLKSYRIFVTEDSPKLWNEFYYYQWHLDKNEEPTDRPKDFMNHCIDAIRYGVYTRYYRKKNDWVA